MSSKEIYVSIELGGKTVPVGKLWGHCRNGRESASFEYEGQWLNNPASFSIDPALPLTRGTFHTSNKQKLFGAIGDYAPDRWGRALMRRADSKRAKGEGAAPHTLMETHYLLGVCDEARQGALRFSESPGGQFLAIGDKNAVPPMVDLPKLLSAAGKFFEKNESTEELKLLLLPGSSLGGARPKASILDRDGSLAIAKFPKNDDDINVVKWEAVSLTLAHKAGITVPVWRLETISKKPVLVIKRFDRHGNERIPFMSAMSMLGATDNEQRSYLDMAYALVQTGAYPAKDMEELWRRIVFTVLVSNTDDHLRNHGFLYEYFKGWTISPAYDINPTPAEIAPRVLSTSIDYGNNQASLEIALSVIPEFQIKKDKAVLIVEEAYAAVSKWNTAAKSIGISNAEIDIMASAFEHDDLKKARDISLSKNF